VAGSRDVKRRIKSVENTRQITRTMELVATSKLKRATDRVYAARPYAEALDEIVGGLYSPGLSEKYPILRRPDEVQRAAILLLTANRGLCGGFNTNISKAAERFIRANKDGYESYELLIVGRKGNDYLKRRAGMEIIKVHEHLVGSGQVTYPTGAMLGQEVIDLYRSDEYDAVFLIYNAFQSAMTQIQKITQLLPIVPKEVDENIHVPEYLYEPNATEVLQQILPKHIEVQIFRSLLESAASEHGARMTAMDSASKNAAEMIGKLTLKYNRARQAAITKELMEIISGAESIK
jgi:F-type H+-transporting ATPase subunit gamma